MPRVLGFPAMGMKALLIDLGWIAKGNEKKLTVVLEVIADPNLYIRAYNSGSLKWMKDINLRVC